MTESEKLREEFKRRATASWDDLEGKSQAKKQIEEEKAEQQQQSELKCTGYIMDNADYIEQHAHCPFCGAFLPYDFPTDTPFNCKKCGTELVCLPDRDEETKEELQWGRICPIKLKAKKP